MMMRHVEGKFLITVAALNVLGVACRGFAFVTGSQTIRKVGIGLIATAILLSIIPLLIAFVYLFIQKIRKKELRRSQG
jgi:hypothetical protein